MKERGYLSNRHPRAAAAVGVRRRAAAFGLDDGRARTLEEIGTFHDAPARSTWFAVRFDWRGTTGARGRSRRSAGLGAIFATSHHAIVSIERARRRDLDQCTGARRSVTSHDFLRLLCLEARPPSYLADASLRDRTPPRPALTLSPGVTEATEGGPRLP